MSALRMRHLACILVLLHGMGADDAPGKRMRDWHEKPPFRPAKKGAKAMPQWEARNVQVGGVEITVIEAGEGRPLLILHDELGIPDWQQWHEAVAATGRKLILPVISGFRGERISWLRSVADLSRLWGSLLRKQGLGPVDVVGLSFGGWLAAEMAINDPRQFSRMLLVAPFGLKPPEGVIADMFLMTSAEYLRSGFANRTAVPEFETLYATPDAAKIEAWEDARIECARLAWQPYMFHPAMEQLLRGVDSLPSLIVWGDKDQIVPESAMRAYANAIPNAHLEILPDCGHRVEIERQTDFVKLLTAFLG